MKLVKDINRLIIIKIIEIAFVTSFVFISIILWKTDNAKNFLAAINTFRNLNYTNLEVKRSVNLGLRPMLDNDAINNLNPYIVNVINDTYTTEEFTLVLKISKESSLDYKYLKISMDDDIYYLTDLEMYEDNQNYLFLLDTDAISGTIKMYEIRLWLDIVTENAMQEKSLFMEFDLINQTTKI